MGGMKVIFPHGLHLAPLTQGCHGKSHWVSAIQHCIFVRHIIYSFFFFPPSLASGSGRPMWRRGPLRTNQTSSRSSTLILQLWSLEKVFFFFLKKKKMFYSNEVEEVLNTYSGTITCVCVFSSLTGSVLTLGNILYVFLFGWWISLIYLLICPVMCLTIFGVPYGLYLFVF